jgi:uncharacterized OB-fold protein
MPAEAGLIVSSWEPAFRHSAGRRGSHFIRAMREEGRLLGWKTARLGVTVPPIESGGPGEWVEVGPGAILIGHAPWGAPVGDSGEDTVLAAVKIDGVDTMVYARVTCDDASSLQAGTRLVADFSAIPAAPSALPRFKLATVGT